MATTKPKRTIVPGPDVVGSAEARKILSDISKQRFHQLASREDFPAYRQLEHGRVWDGAEVRAWALTRSGGPLEGKPVLLAVRMWRVTGNVVDAADACRVDTETVRVWLKRIEAWPLAPSKRQRARIHA